MMSVPRSKLFLGILLLTLAILSAKPIDAVVQAQGIIIDPPIAPPPVTEPLFALSAITVEAHRVAAVIDGPVAEVQVTQVFRNDSGHTVEGTYLFPLPADAAVSDFQLTVDGRVLEGKLLNKEEARRIYEEIVRRQRDPALLEYVGGTLFQTSVFPIPAGASRKIEFRYAQVVGQNTGLYEFVYPLRTYQYSVAPVKSLSVAVTLRNQPGLRTIYSPSHAVSIERTSDSSAVVSYEANNVQPEQDFSLFYGVDKSAVGLNLLSYKPAGEDGFFVLLAAPSIEVAQDAIVARDLVLVLDISGSMQGQKMEQARTAAHFLVDALNEEDRFNLIAFSTGVQLWEGELQPADETSRQQAHRWIDALAAGGSTDINRGLLEALAQLTPSTGAARPAYVLFMTDGLPTMGEVEAPRIVNNAVNNRPDRTIRLFTFGVGFDVNTDLLDMLSQELGGRSSYVTPDEAIDEEISHFYAGISTPVLVDIALSFGTVVTVDELYPYPLPDLFAGDQLVVVGRYRKGGPVTVTLRGSANGETLTYQYPNRELVGADGDAFVARLWATRKVGALLDAVRRSGPLPELVDEIVELSMRYGIVTPYTSYLVVEPELAQAAPGGQTQLFDLRAQAQDEVQMGADAVAAAPASGEAAVAASETRNKLANAANVQESGGVRYLNGKSFVRQSLVRNRDGSTAELWVDTLYREGMQIETIVFGSERYFALARQPGLATWLALSPELLIVLEQGTAIRITGAE